MQVRVRGLGSHARRATPRAERAGPRPDDGDGDGPLCIYLFLTLGVYLAYNSGRTSITIVIGIGETILYDDGDESHAGDMRTFELSTLQKLYMYRCPSTPTTSLATISIPYCRILHAN